MCLFIVQEGRTPYHYTAMCRDPVAIQNLLKSAGADPTILDNRQRSAKYYMKNPSELELPSVIRSAPETKKSKEIKESEFQNFLGQMDDFKILHTWNDMYWRVTLGCSWRLPDFIARAMSWIYCCNLIGKCFNFSAKRLLVFSYFSNFKEYVL